MKRAIPFLIIAALFGCTSSTTEPAKTEVKDAATTTAAVPPVTVLADAETQILKDGIKAYADGNLDAWLANQDDNVKVYYPGPGDSLMGKEALKAFFKTRMDSVASAEVINPTYLGVDVAPGGTAAPGKWLMAWYTWNIKYKNGKTARFPIQITEHLNAAGKVDVGIWYYDLARAFANPPKP